MRLPNPVLICCLLGIFVSACTQKPVRPVDERGAEITAESRDTEKAADSYYALAQLSAGPDRNTNLLKAAELYVSNSNFDNAQNSLSLINVEIASAEILRNMQILTARIALGQGKPREALKLLTFSDILPNKQQIDVYKLRAQAFLDAAYPLEAAKTRVQMDKFIEDETEKEANNQAIWEALSLLPETTLQQLSYAPLHPQFLGWIEFAHITKRAQIDNQHLQESIYKWRKKYPQHPAINIFNQEMGLRQTELMEQPSHIAIMLPLTGQYAQITNAIRDGFMTAYFQQSIKQKLPEITFIDTGSQENNIWNHYQKAVDAGADFIVGPFLKSAVNQLASAEQLIVPTLSLNYAESQTQATPNLFQMGLLPEDEARQSAEMAFRQGHTHAAILVPEGQWGQRLSNSFQQRFEELGGVVINTETYVSGRNDFKHPIQKLLNIDQSIARHKKLESILKTDLKFTPYRRQDVDMIFMAATPKDARQLKPQFRFHYAGELPVYSTSHVFTGQIDNRADRDIDEILYCDMPWILNPSKRLNQAFTQNWPEHQQYTRFFALGTDAYYLIPYLKRLQTRSYERFSGQTGNIYLDSFNRLRRELLWAQFINGQPVILDLNTLPQDLSLNVSKNN
ncbi:MAG: penicillin-binding protein activator [Gammaproteobacteria bacterium]|nr:penicillin-binding protein activator [Gammaproteobacteria bacterium]MDH5735917.1 penicillin-binding protein activator [Gammaproteobacteria bacterium]